MFNRWASFFQKRKTLYSVIRQKLKQTTTLAFFNTKKKLGKVIVIGALGFGGYMMSNEIYSEHLEKKKMKKKLMHAYPDQTYIISFEEDSIELLREVEITSKSEEVHALENKHCVHIKSDRDPEFKLLEEKLGSNVIVFSPKTLDELCHAIERCHKYRHSAVVGDYPMPDFRDLNLQELKKALSRISQPMRKRKYVVIDLSHFNKADIDNIDDVLEAETGTSCAVLNQKLEKAGFQPLFEKYYENMSLYEVLINNLPLTNTDALANKIVNLSLISAEGIRFKSSTEVSSFGQIPSLTPLFLGTGGVFAVPAKANIRIKRKSKNPVKKVYHLSSNNTSELILQWRKVRQELSQKQAKYQLTFPSLNSLQIQTDQPLQNLPPTNPPTNPPVQTELVLSINHKITQKLVLKNPSPNIQIHNNILKISSSLPQQQIMKLVSDISLEGGVLVWCRNQELANRLKMRTDLLETGAELMRKIVEIREGVDRRHVLYSHARFEKYFAKGVFRTMTQFFW